jgi:hypothetical protein
VQPSIALPSEVDVWTVLSTRIQTGLTERKSKILELSGIHDEFGPPGDGFTGQLDADQLTLELSGAQLVAFATDIVARSASASMERKAGRPRDVLTRELGPPLLALYMRYHDSAGRQSVLTSVDGRLVQEEAGPLFEFVKLVIEPLNEYLVTELHWKSLSPARLARYALAERRSIRAARRN